MGARLIGSRQWTRHELVHAAGCTYEYCATRLSLEWLFDCASATGAKVPRSLRAAFRTWCREQDRVEVVGG